MRIHFCALAVLALSSVVDSFAGLKSTRKFPLSATSISLSSRNASPQGISADVISRLAEVALKLRLPEENGVKFDVKANPQELLSQGKVGPVTVRGRGWRSPRGLSCRLIEATVSRCELDIGRVIGNQKLVLLTPALGNCMIAFNADDLANFLTHPLVKPPTPSSGKECVRFLKDDAEIDPQKGLVIFCGQYAGTRWRFNLIRKCESKVVVSASPADSTATDDLDVDTLSTELGKSVTNFFNNLLVELDGTFLTFRDMSITPKGATPSLMLKLDIKVEKFPAPNGNF